MPKLKILPENTEVAEEKIPFLQNAPPPATVELILQKARLERRLSLTEIAQRLCLSEPTIKALEEERWDFFFQENSYLLGFIHSYGRLLDISVEDVANRFKAFKASPLIDDKENWLTNQSEAPQSPSHSILLGSLCSSLLLIFLLTPCFRLQQQIDLDKATHQETITLKCRMTFPLRNAPRGLMRKASFLRSSSPSISSKNFLELLKERLS